MTNLTEETAKELNDKLERLLTLLEPKTPSPKQKTKKELRQAEAEEWVKKFQLKCLKKNLKERGL